MLVNKKEALRYLGYGSACPTSSELEIIDECSNLLENEATPRTIYKKLPLEIINRKLFIATMEIESMALLKALDGCDNVYVFAATLGSCVDTLIRREGAVSITRAAVIQAAAACAIETVCDNECNKIALSLKESGLFLRPRFSPGYGDFSLIHQPDILNILQAHKIGLSCTDSFMLTPTKSVTAIIGVSPTKCIKTGCGECTKSDCEFRKSK